MVSYFSSKNIVQGILIISAVLSIFLVGEINAFLNKTSFFGRYCNLEAYPFQLQNAEGEFVALSDFSGKYCYLFFGYTLCAESCPQAISTLITLADTIDTNDVAFIFISIDNERDNQERLAAFQKNLGQKFVVLHGTTKEILKTTRKYFSYYGKIQNRSKNQLDEHQINHTDNIYFIDDQGAIRLIYQKSRQKVTQMTEDFNYFTRR